MTISSDPFTPSAGEPTTALPGPLDMKAVLPELSSPQERYDHGFQRGYLAGYAEGERQARAENAHELDSQKAAGAAAQARASALVSQLASATEGYIAQFGPRDGALSERLVAAAFALAEAVINAEVRTRPDLAVEVARSVLARLPTGPALVRVNPADERLVGEAASGLGSGQQHVRVVADPRVGPGGCMVTAGAKTADARIEEALARAREAFCSPPQPAEDAGEDQEALL
ncbi:MAG: FliH/SctL family protein [Acidimicrobiales bacterium]